MSDRALYEKVSVRNYGNHVGTIVWQGNVDILTGYSLIALPPESSGWSATRTGYFHDVYDIPAAEGTIAEAVAKALGLTAFTWERTDALLDPVVPEVTEPVPTGESLESERAQILAERQEHQQNQEAGFARIIAGIGDALKAEAENRDYCREFEQAVDSMSNDLPYPYADVMREHAMREGMLAIEYDISWTVQYTSTVTASSENEARETFREDAHQYVRSALYSVEVEIDDVCESDN